MKLSKRAINERSYVRSTDNRDKWDRVRELNRVFIVRFFTNVRFILRGVGVTQKQMKEDMFIRYGFVISQDAVNRYIKNEHYTTVSINYLQFFCMYLDQPLDRMIADDYSQPGYIFTCNLRGVGAVGG